MSCRNKENFTVLYEYILGTLRCHDGDDNENVKKNWLNKQNNNSARAPRHHHTTTFLLFSLDHHHISIICFHSTTTTFPLFSLHHHHISIVFTPPPPHFYCFHSTNTTFLLFSLLLLFSYQTGQHRPTSGQKGQTQIFFLVGKQ